MKNFKISANTNLVVRLVVTSSSVCKSEVTSDFLSFTLASSYEPSSVNNVAMKLLFFQH